MFSIKGPGLKIFASILAVIAIAFGVYSTFIRSAGYETTTGTITSIEEDPDYIPDADSDNDVQYIVKATYTVDGKEYNTTLDSYSPSYKVGGEVEIKYDPNDPSKMTSGFGIGVAVMIVGAVILLVVIGSTVIGKKNLKQQKETVGETVYAPSQKGSQRELYFLTDIGTPKYGHRIEDKNRKVLYEAKMTKYTLTSPFGFDFIDHEHGKTTPHLVGHQEDTDWNSLIIDNHSTFTFDGEQIWKHLKRNGIRVDSSFGADGDKLLGVNYTIYRDNEEIARVISTSQYVHEEDAEKHKAMSNIPVHGFYRIWTSEQNLDLLFVTLLAFARTDASDDKGGSRRALFNTLKGE